MQKEGKKYFKTTKGKTTLKTMLKEYFNQKKLISAAPPKLSARKSRWKRLKEKTQKF